MVQIGNRLAPGIHLPAPLARGASLDVLGFAYYHAPHSVQADAYAQLCRLASEGIIALAHEAMGRSDHAFSDYGRALELDPGLTAAALNRGLLFYKSGRHQDAIADFLRALRASAASREDAIGQIHYNLALAYFAVGDRLSALASGEKALNLGCGEARGLCDRLRNGS